MGFGVLLAGACGGHSAGHRSAGCVGISPFSSHVSECLIRFTSNITASMSRHSLLLINTNTEIANLS